MIMRLDRLQAEIPPPSVPDPNGASIVQELLGGKFGEMSTFMNYTYQSFNFRNRQGARPFYDLIASIAAEEFGHIELVSTAINTMLTGALDGKPGKKGALRGLADCRNSQQFLAGAASATVQDADAGEIEEIAQKLRQAAGLPKEPTGVVAQEGKVAKAKKAVKRQAKKA
jgi:Mn-containing catalase